MALRTANTRLCLRMTLIVLLLGFGVTTAATAQEAPAASFPAGIYQGTCDSLSGDAIYQLADVTYGPPSGAAGLTAATPSPGDLLGPPEAVYTAWSVSEIDTGVQNLADPPHAIVVFESAQSENRNPIACGVIGGIFTDENLIFGLLERNASGYVGTGWVRAVGDGPLQVTVILFSLPATTGEDAAATATPAAAASPSSAAETPATGDAAAEEVTVEMVDIDFNPNEFSIPADTDVTVRLPNNGAVVHNFNIDGKNNPSDPGIHSGDVQPGNETTVTLNLPAGDWYYYCNIAGHEAAGMFGTVHVG